MLIPKTTNNRALLNLPFRSPWPGGTVYLATELRVVNSNPSTIRQLLTPDCQKSTQKIIK